MARCIDFPCCGHTDLDPCEPQWYDAPGAFDTSRPGNEHALCNHPYGEYGECDVPEPDPDDDDDSDGEVAMITRMLALMRRDLENGCPPEFLIGQLLDMAGKTEGFENYQITSALRELAQEPTLPCPTGQHGEQEIAGQGSNSGFAGGTIYWVRLACGCTEMDESDDVRAAL